MTKTQFKAMKKLWENDCGKKAPVSIIAIDYIISRPVLDSLVKSELLEETRVSFPQTESRQFRMTAKGIEELWRMRRCAVRSKALGFRKGKND